MSSISLIGKMCMITGANSGIGKSVTVRIASAGATVVMVCRDMKKGEAAKAEVVVASGNNSVEILIVDLASLESVWRLAQTRCT